MSEHNRFGFVVAVLSLLILAGKCLDINRALADDRRRPTLEAAQSRSRPAGPDTRAMPAFRGGSPITAATAGEAKSAGPPVPFVKPKAIWDRFLILVWQYKTDVRQDLALYQRVGFREFHIDRGSGRKDLVQFANKYRLPYYVDHVADKGYLHLTDRTGRTSILRKRTVVPRPHSLADPKTMAILKDHIRKNVSVTRYGPAVAYAFDDEVSLGSFTSPCEVDGSPLSVAGYRT